MKYAYALSALAAISGVAADVALWGQCGGANYNGQTVCAAPATCSTLNPYYAQCLSAAGGVKTTTTSSTTRPPVVTTTPARTTTTSSSVVPPRTTTTSAIVPPRTTTTPSVGVTTTPSVGVTTTPKPVTTTAGPVGSAGPAVTITGNPFAGRQQYPNPYYSSEVISIAIPSLIAGNKASLTAAAKAVATVPNFIWFDVIAKVPTLSTYLADIRAKNKAGANPPIIGTFVVYDLPDRDCAALASNGELAIAANGAARYKTEYIDPFAAQLKQFPDVPVALIIEPDSLANMITNLGVPKCAGAQKTYEDSVIYALKTLNLPNVGMYVDAGHAGWLGWPDNLKKAATYYGALYKNAGSPSQLRGLATNVANYNAWSVATCPSYTSGLAAINGICDEKRYINALSPLLNAAGFPAHFVTDQGRSGKQPTGQIEWGDWCNALGTGFGLRPDSPTGDPLLDAFVWIKPGGEGDGTSDQSASRYDSHCGSAASLKPAPEAGTWFQAYFEQLLVNANPKF